MDVKRFICRETNAAFSEKMQHLFDLGQIVPFSVLFPETVCRAITNEDKKSKDIIQFGFLVSDCDGKVLLTYRTPLSEDKQAGHVISVKESVLVGWSPVISIPGEHPYPMSDDDILWAYHQEVRDSHLRKARVRFLGLVQNEIKGIRFYFYLFNVSYAERAPDLTGLLKDKHDLLCAYHSVDDSLFELVRDKKADLRALELYSGRDLGRFDMGKSHVVPFSLDTKPPFRIHAPDVFISHATQDDGVASRIADACSSAGLTCWTDHQSLKAGNIWFKEIEAGIKYGGCFLLLCSRSSVNSQSVADEVLMALERQDRWHSYPIVPLVLDGDKKREVIPASLGHCQAWDMRNVKDRDSQIPALIDRIKEILPGLSSRED